MTTPPIHLMRCSLISTKFTALPIIPIVIAKAPKAAVPPSVLQALFRFNVNPQINKAEVYKRVRVEEATFRTASPKSTTAGLLDKSAKDKAEEAIASGPKRRR